MHIIYILNSLSFIVYRLGFLSQDRWLFARNFFNFFPGIRFAQGFIFRKIDQDRRCHEDGRVATGNNTDQHRESKSTCYLTTYEEKNQHSEKYRERGHDGSAQRFIDRFIDDGGLVDILCVANVFADTVIYHHGIVHRETDHRQDGRNEVLVNFEREWHYVAEVREYRQRHQHVVQERHDRTH